MSYWLHSLKTLRCSQSVVVSIRRRQYSAIAAAETITVPCQSNGSITVDLHHPSNVAAEKNSAPAVLVYLPQGPFAHHAERDGTNVSVLRSVLPCPIVQINYRLSEHYKYPTPIHDLLCGFDWIVDNMLPKRGSTRFGLSESVGKIAVYGEQIGGGLATALALTECRAGQPGIVAAAVANPVVDWVSIDEVAESITQKLKPKRPPLEDGNALLERQRLLYLRTQLFRKPEGYFDPFASPILFFRSAGARVPPPPADIPVDELEQLSLLERDHFDRQDIRPASDGPSPSSDRFNVNASRDPTLRRASRRFPSKALGLRLPQFRISADGASPLRDQATELARVLRQSVVRQSKDATPSASDSGQKVLIDNELEDIDDEQRELAKVQMADAERKVELRVHDISAARSDSAIGTETLRETAEWLKDRLE